MFVFWYVAATVLFISSLYSAFIRFNFTTAFWFLVGAGIMCLIGNFFKKRGI